MNLQKIWNHFHKHLPFPSDVRYYRVDGIVVEPFTEYQITGHQVGQLYNIKLPFSREKRSIHGKRIFVSDNPLVLIRDNYHIYIVPDYSEMDMVKLKLKL